MGPDDANIAFALSNRGALPMDNRTLALAASRSTALPRPVVTSLSAAPSEPFPTQRGRLAALDGLRLVAALSVMIAHGFDYLIIFERNQDINAHNAPLLIADIGMTLFFVLSGFVIHYNYAASIEMPGGRRSFFVARFARLYPLFLLVFVVEAIRLRGRTEGGVDLLGPAPLYLTFTQSWWFWMLGKRMACQAYDGGSGLMWSLSTEAFFYALYPLLAPLLRRLSGRRLLAAAMILGLWAPIAGALVVRYRQPLTEMAVHATGNPAAAPLFITWLGFYSPWLRIVEFLLGAVAAQFIATVSWTRNAAAFASWTAIVLILTGHLIATTQLLPINTTLMTCLSPLFAILVAAAATGGHPISRVLSWRWMVWGGQASYSLYLLHYWVLHEFGVRLAWERPRGERYGIWLGLMLVSLLVAQVCYRLYERPAQRWVRRLLGGGRAPAP
jgi:peptidoglycan/LPS O-acetylase OafA/YrhL